MDTTFGHVTPDSGNDLVKDSTVETFEQDVINASMAVPVIVDFWADWCGPCKQLGPMLEKAVHAAGGSVRMVKVDIDKNQMLAGQLRIQSVPTVYAFFQGRPIDGFQGALPESEIKGFIDRVTAAAAGGAAPEAPGDPTADYLNAGEAAFEEGDVAAAAQLFSQVAQADPTNVQAITGLARCHVALGDVEKAQATLDVLPEEARADPALDGIRASIALAQSHEGGSDVTALRAAAAANPESLETKFELAGALLSSGSMQDGMDTLFEIIEKDREWNEDAARKKLLTVFDALGAAHPDTLRGRRRLSSILFS